MARFGDFDQYLDDAGDPLVEGKLYFYESGTTTPKTTYADINNSIPNTNPVLLSAAGRQPNIFFDGVAKVILTDNNDVQIAVRDPAGATGTDFGDEWVATKIYNAVDVVLGSDGIYYRSLINGNQNNNPVTTTGSWTLLYSVEWNQGITYSVGDVVTYGSQQYQSLQNSNLNQNPATQTAYWVPLNFAWVATATYSEDQNVVGTDGILYTSLQNSNTGNDPATSPAYWVGTSAAAAASAVAAAASEAAAAASEAAAETAETNAETAQAAAEAAQAAAETAETNAETAETGAEAAQAAAEAAQSAAETAQANAETAETNAETAETNAEAAQTAAEAAQSAAETAQTGAETAETNAETAQAAAEAAQAAAETAETNAETAETNAEAAQTAAEAAQSAAETAQTNAETAETNAAGSASDASGFADAAQASATAAAGSATDASDKYDEFDARYLGEKASDPSVDNQGGALVEGALYFNTASDAMKVYDGASWVNVAPVATSVTISQISDYTGDATTLNYTSNLSSDAQTQLNAKVETLGDLGVTATATELNYTDGVTSAIQTQLNAKEPADATILKDADIGSTVQAYDANTAKYDDTTSNFTGTLQNGGSNVLVDSDVGSSVLGYVAPSTSGNILTSDGTNWTSAAPSGGGLEEFIAEYTLPSDASTFTVDDSVFSDSSYDYILIKGSLRVTATNAYFYIYYRNSSGTNQTGNYGYTSFGSSGSSSGMQGGSAQSRMNFLGINYSLQSYPLGYTPDAYFETRIYHNEPSLVSLTTGSWLRSGTNTAQQFHSGSWSGSAFTFGGIQFVASTGNANAGSKVKIYGVKGS